MRKTKVKKKLADAAGGLESAKERHQKYHTPQSYRNNPVLSNRFYKLRRTHRQRYPLLKNQSHIFEKKRKIS